MTTDAVGGIWAHADDLRRTLHSGGVEVVLAAIGPEPPPDPQVPHRPGRLEWQADPWDDLDRTGEWLLGLADEHAVDVVHLNSFALGTLEWRRPSLVVGHSCVLSWHEAVRGTPAGPEWAEYRKRVRAGLLAADEVVAPTAGMLQALRRHYDLGERGRVVLNGIPPAAPAAPGRREGILAAGRLWDEAKGLDVLDAAARGLGARAEVAGADGEARHVTLLGPLPRGDLRARMARAAVFAHPARYEPFGLVVAEAAAAGCALVLGDIPTLRELWDGAALFAAPGDAAALHAALEHALEDPAPLAAAARRRAERYGAAAMAAGYREVYERVGVPA